MSLVIISLLREKNQSFQIIMILLYLHRMKICISSLIHKIVYKVKMILLIIYQYQIQWKIKDILVLERKEILQVHSFKIYSIAL